MKICSHSLSVSGVGSSVKYMSVFYNFSCRLNSYLQTPSNSVKKKGLLPEDSSCGLTKELLSLLTKLSLSRGMTPAR